MLVRLEELREPDQEARYSGRIIKILTHAKKRILGIFRALPAGGGRIVPVDKKSLGREISIAPGATMDAEDGELVAADLSKEGRFGLPTGRIKERLGSLKSERAVSLIAIHAHSIPNVFSNEALAEAEAAKPADLTGREDWRKIPLITIDPADAKDHDDAVFAEPDRDPDNRGGHVVTVAIADVAHYVRPGSALDREALDRGNSVHFPDRVVPMLPERISNDLCSLKPNVDRAALAVRMVIAPDGRKRSHTFHRILMRSAAKLELHPGAGCHRRPDRRSDRTDQGAGSRTALRCLSHRQESTRSARSARPRSARAKDPAEAGWHARSRDHSRTPRRA